MYSAIHSMDQLSVEPEKIKKWREEQKIRLETKGWLSVNHRFINQKKKQEIVLRIHTLISYILTIEIKFINRISSHIIEHK